ncbi:ABC transporter ATP-binding protein [Robertkochia marina]|uniref:ABC transporter ATP-binding protein n=1 Tax=Robertkochia marina TaxID=1227945 RepID=A0A4S3LXC6_9FLAO|nr:ABC transporter ATP-binding protein [Robertkochia marina]THD65828.1 ABC transporter ATP-binding protein [Robertkochia marina]TRZ41331.1 ABC transporter ATP-binding protein [Robertkochia marina]
MKELRYINKFFKKYRWKLLIGVIITIIARVFSLVMPEYVQYSVDAIESYLLNNTQDLDAVKATLLKNILIIIGSAALSALFTFLMRQTIINVSRYIEFDMKNEVFDQYEKLSLGFYKKNRTGDLMNRISEDVGKVRMYGGPALMYSIQTLTLFACVIPLMFYTAPKLALYTLIPLPFLSVLIYRISRIIHVRSTKVQEFLSELSTFTQETFSGVSVIKAYGIEGRINGEWNTLANKGKDTSMSLAKVNAWFFPLMILLIGISNLFVIYIGGIQYINGEIATTGVILKFIIYVNMLTWPVATVGWVTSIVQMAEASQKRINEFLQEEPEISNPETPAVDIEGHIEFRNVSFTYDDTNITALKNVSFSVDPGETLAVIGKTGAGKSTILELVARLYDPTQGDILIDGHPIQEVNLDTLRESIGTVPQDAFLFSDTIGNNIRFGKADASEQEVVEAAKMAAVHNNIAEFTKGYNTVLGERGITLSGGQKQRVSIARALIKNPKIYLFDDCLSAVDTETEEEILGNLKRVANSVTTIIVSHRISSAKNADKILVLDNGEIKQQGTHAQLISEDGYYKELYLSQLSEKENF